MTGCRHGVGADCLILFRIRISGYRPHNLRQPLRVVILYKKAADTILHDLRQGAPVTAHADQAAGHGLHHGDAKALRAVRQMDKHIRIRQQLRHVVPGAQKLNPAVDVQFLRNGL